MTEKLWYMIGLLVNTKGIHLGYRVINKITFEIKDISDESVVALDEIDNLEIAQSNKGSFSVNIKGNAGKVEKYTIANVELGRLIQGKYVIVMQNSYYTIVDYYGKVMSFTKNEFYKIVESIGSVNFANIKASDGTTKKSASAGCIKAPFDFYDSVLWQNLIINNTEFAANGIDCQLKARINGVEFARELGIQTDSNLEQLENNRVMLQNMLFSTPKESIKILKFISNSIKTDKIFDTDICARLLDKTGIPLGRYIIRKRLDKCSGEYIISHEDLDIYKDGNILTKKELPTYLSMRVRPYGKDILICGIVGCSESNPALNIVFKFNCETKSISYNSYYTNAKYDCYTQKDNYKRALRLIGKDVDTLYRLTINYENDGVINRIIDIHDRILVLDGYIKLGTLIHYKKVVDFDKAELNKYALTAYDIDNIFKRIGCTSTTSLDVSKANRVSVLPINRYEYVKIYLPDGMKLPKVKSGEWQTDITEGFRYIIELYTEGQLLNQYIWYNKYTDGNSITWNNVYNFIDNTFNQIVPLNMIITNVRRAHVVTADTIRGLENTCKSITLMASTIFTKYNPFRAKCKLKHLSSDTRDEDRIDACWDYGVSIVNGGYYLYIRVEIKNKELVSLDERSLVGLIEGKDINKAVIPILRFKTYRHMYNFYLNNPYLRTDEYEKAAIKFAKMVVFNKKIHNTTGVQFLDELIDCATTGNPVSMSGIADFTGPITEAGIII